MYSIKQRSPINKSTTPTHTYVHNYIWAFVLIFLLPFSVVETPRCLFLSKQCIVQLWKTEQQASALLCEQRALCILGWKPLGEEKLSKVCHQPPWVSEGPLEKSWSEVTSELESSGPPQSGDWAAPLCGPGWISREMWSEDACSLWPIRSSQKPVSAEYFGVGGPQPDLWPGGETRNFITLPWPTKSRPAAEPQPDSQGVVLPSG